MNLNFCKGALRLCLLVPTLAGWMYGQSASEQQQSTGTGETQQTQEAPPAKPAPAKAAQTNGRTTNDGGFSLGLFYWDTAAHPVLRGSAGPGAALDLPGKSGRSPGFVLSFPAGRHNTNNTLRVSYFQTKGSGDTVAPQDVVLFDQNLTNGDYLQTQYKIQNVKVSFDYLTYPNPPGSTGFRLKTLWEVQYTNIKTIINAPLVVDSTGAAAPVTAQGSRTIIFPTFGLGFEQIVSRNFRIEGKASGFGIPHHAAIWDADAAAVIRVKGVELALGYKGFYFKTSPQNAQYVIGTLSGAFVGLRWGQ